MREIEKRILVVDDDDAIRALLLTILRRRGYKLDTAKNGAEAIDRCLKCQYAVVLLDLMMPLMSGYDFLEQIRSLPKSQRPVVIVLTAGALPAKLDPDVVAGSVRKPFDIELLVDTVSGCLGIRDGRAQLENCPGADSETRAAEGNEKPN